MKTHILHHDSLAGFGAAFAAWLKLGDSAIYTPLHHGQRVNTIKANEDREFDYYDITHFSAIETWNRFHSPKVAPRLMRYLDDHADGPVLPRSREFAAALASYPRAFERWRGLLIHDQQVGTLIEELAAEGEHCLRLQKALVRTMANNHCKVIFSGALRSVHWRMVTSTASFGQFSAADEWCLPCANAPVLGPEVADALLELYPDAPCAAYWFDRAPGVRQWGLRSRPGFDSLVIARAFGGAGRPQDCGFVQESA